MIAAGVAACLAAGAAALSVAPLHRLPADVGRRPARRLPAPLVVAASVAGISVVLPTRALSAHQLALGVVGAAAAAGVLRMVHRSRRDARAGRRAEQVLEACESMAADLAAGQSPLAALDRATREWAELQPARSAAHLGADVPAALRELAERPGAGELRVLAAAWQVGHESGCGLGDAVAAAAAAIRERRATARLVGSELAAANATARLMAALPFAVLLLGAGVGGDPVGFLTGSSPGLGCLAGGLLLCYAGLAWLRRIADEVLGR